MIRPAIRTLLVVAFVAAGVSLSGPQASAADSSAGAPSIAPLIGASAARTTTMTTVTTDLDTGAVLTGTLVSEYNAAGKLVHSLDSDVRDDGYIQGSSELTATYDAAGRLISTVTIDSLDGDGPMPPTTTVEALSYNAKGILIKIVTTIDEGSDGSIERTDTSSFGPDRRGRIVTAQYVTEGFGDTYTTNISTTYDARGNVLATDQTTDQASTPQNPDFSSIDSTTYNRKGQVVSASSAAYVYDATGTQELTGSSLATLTYDARGNLLTFSAAADADGDGTDETFTVSTNTYNAKNKPVLQTSTSTNPAVTTESRLTLTYGRGGRLSVQDSFESVNGNPDNSRHVTFAYDGKGRLVLSVDEFDDHADGSVDTTATTTQGFDRKGRVTSSSVSSFDNIADHLAFSIESTIVYSRTTIVSTTSIDSDGDGTVDQTIVTTQPV